MRSPPTAYALRATLWEYFLTSLKCAACSFPETRRSKPPSHRIPEKTSGAAAHPDFLQPSKPPPPPPPNLTKRTLSKPSHNPATRPQRLPRSTTTNSSNPISPLHLNRWDHPSSQTPTACCTGTATPCLTIHTAKRQKPSRKHFSNSYGFFGSYNRQPSATSSSWLPQKVYGDDDDDGNKFL